MSAPSGNKRQRANTAGDAVGTGPIDYGLLISSLPTPTLSKLLHSAAIQHPDVATSIVNEHNKIILAKRAKTINFDHYSQCAWNIVNVKYGHLSGSKQFDRGFDAASEVEACIKAIRKATPAHSNLETKKSALETLIKIGKCICLGGGEVGKVVRQEFQYDPYFQPTMLKIVKRLTMEERNALMTQEFLGKLLELEKESSGYRVFENLTDVRLVLLGEQDSANGEIEDDEENEENEEDDDEENEENEEDEEDENDEDEENEDEYEEEDSEGDDED